MIEILSLPRRPHNKLIQIKNIRFKSGLPINSLPGWEHIPLNSKLPMLKFPGNQVIFSKNKIGQSFRHLKQEFNASTRDNFPEYNPLHDSNLKTFYANERNLKRLRENGEITQENDVICNLKDFNEYRQQLHTSQLYYILQELKRLEAEQHDRMLISNAEAITNRDHRHLSARQHSHTGILLRKQWLEEQRSARYQKLLAKTADKFQRIAAQAEMDKAMVEHKRLLSQLKMQQHFEVCSDLQRKRLISLKKLFQFKKDRLQKNFKILYETRARLASAAQFRSWQKRLDERIAHQEKVKALLEKVATQRQVFIANHVSEYQEKWAKIQDEIKRRAHSMKRLKRNIPRRKKKKKVPLVEEKSEPPIHSYCSVQLDNFDKMLDSELCEALNTALDLEERNKVPFSQDDPIYKAAKFIVQHIIAKFDKDLSGDKVVFACVAERIEKFFEEAIKFVIFRASQIIASTRKALKNAQLSCDVECDDHRRPANVSFSQMSSVIGMSSYEIHPFINLRTVFDRTPTPGGSLASIVVESKEKTPSLCRNEVIFIEHYMIKFKRELIVGMSKRVFGAIDCHFQHKVMDVRPALLELDRQFLVRQVTIAILSYAMNPLNFEACLKLCVGTFSTEIICSLQKHLLRPECKSRIFVWPDAEGRCEIME